MKLFGNIYTALSAEELAPSLGLNSWEVTVLSDDHVEFIANNVQLSLEGRGELLFFGQLHLPLQEIDQWVEGLSTLAIHFSLDLHGDEARLMRRYHQ